MKKLYVGTLSRDGIGGQYVEVVTIENDVETRHRLSHVVRHSPDGFNWGYGGSGPSDLALSIAYDCLSKEDAERYYMHVKARFVAPAGPKLRIDADDVVAWIEGLKTRPGQ